MNIVFEFWGGALNTNSKTVLYDQDYCSDIGDMTDNKVIGFLLMNPLSTHTASRASINISLPAMDDQNSD